ncbi:MAG TPA: IPT/TIG domain-containing protein [Blastocatellia bacterium]|nr:IPT/TIG domain-containing protein [Blastocatellia bacterium]
MSINPGGQSRLLLVAGCLLAAVALVYPGVSQGPMIANSMSPTTGHPGTVVTITGVNFGATQGTRLVAIGQTLNIMEVRSWSDRSIQVVVPSLPVGEHLIMVYYDATYSRSAPWDGSHTFRIIPGRLSDRPGTGSDVPNPPDPRLAPLGCTAVNSRNLLQNPDFERVGPENPSYLHRDGREADHSAAYGWDVFVNGTLDITTKLIGSPTAPAGSTGKVLHVIARNGSSGPLQNLPWIGLDHGPRRVTFSVRVWVVSGAVQVGVGNGGQNPPTAFSRAHGRWETIEGCSHPDVKHCNQMFISSKGINPAEFYIDSAEVRNADSSWSCSFTAACP